MGRTDCRASGNIDKEFLRRGGSSPIAGSPKLTLRAHSGDYPRTLFIGFARQLCSDIYSLDAELTLCLSNSRLRPGALPQGAQGLQGPSRQGLRRHRPGRDLLRAEDPQVARGGGPGLLAEGVREHGCRGRGPGGRRRRCGPGRRRGLAGRGGGG